MENSLQKNHVLSEYAVLINNKCDKSIGIKEPTGITHSIEESDPDEFVVSEITVETRSVETSDPDELYIEPTKHTFTIETSDEDEFLWR